MPDTRFQTEHDHRENVVLFVLSFFFAFVTIFLTAAKLKTARREPNPIDPFLTAAFWVSSIYCIFAVVAIFGSIILALTHTTP